MGKSKSKGKIKKTAAAVLALSVVAATALAFDWPQDETSSDSFFSYFGQFRGGTMESSLIFRDASTVKAADSGHVAAIITEHTNDYGWFESTLGNAVIIAHDYGFSTIYGNLDEETLHPELFDMDTVSVGQEFGESGNSGWQEGQSCLEFQVIDVEQGLAINPRNLMPRIGKELPLSVGTVSLDDKNGLTHLLVLEKNLPAGKYAVYHTRQDISVPYKTVVSLNGATVESISYDSMKEVNGKLCVTGNSTYPASTIYPDEKRQLLGNVQLNHGLNRLDVTLVDILGDTKTVTYNLEAY
ncbi:MAG: M23 family metallopeptidase [Treponema sp.]|jgi:hypothetical protein|nr:M23 family metallopeptidase [Treponema sp.]MBQ5400574.1 M23 family metallopeptidase [Treponema sp.]